jgi:hypothetical protein
MIISTPIYPRAFNMEQASGFNQRVDKDGCLDLIQKLEYNSLNMTFEITYFTGWEMRFDAGSFCTGLDMMVSDLTFRQMREAYTRIEMYSLEHWQEWYVDRFPMKH